MPHTATSKAETIVRILLTIIVLFNSVIPTVALAKPVNPAKPVTGQTGDVRNFRPESKPVHYQLNAPVPNPTRFSPQADEQEPETPAKDLVEFSISTSQGEVDNDRSLTIDVIVRNNSEAAIGSLVFSDKLEAGLKFVSSVEESMKYTTGNNIVRHEIGILNPGDEVRFSYTIKVNSRKVGKLSIHNAEIEYEADGKIQTQVASLGFADSSSQVESDALIVVPDKAGDGWETAGRYSLYLGEEVLTQEAVVAIAPADAPGEGPELQFDLELIQTTAPTTVAGGELREQDINLGQVVETEFKEPAYLEINLDGVADLEDIPAGQEPYVATYDEEHDIWVKVPIVETDPETNSITVEAAHFSTWGAGLGNSLPQNGANVLLFDQPYTSLFTGASRYSIPIWTPPGRAGMSPDISLSYSSATADGVLGDVQAPWVGMGWNIDGVEIVRKITTNENGYGYVNDFALTLNGTVYELVVDTDDKDQSRYYTKQGSFLYIERHNKALKNDDGVNNTTGEWWEVVTTDGTKYRLGWNNNSEQLALMYGYGCNTGNPCTTPNGAYGILGYAGTAENLVALRWRVDRITDTHGNYISYTYSEKQPTSTIAPFDRESYLETISYTGFNGQNNSEGYRVEFVAKPRSDVGIGDVPVAYNIWDNLDSRYLDRIEIKCLKCGSSDQYVRVYEFKYSLAPVPNENGTLTLTSIKVRGEKRNGAQVLESTEAPDIKFTYQNLDNLTVTGSTKKFTYPRLLSINNGTEGVLTYTYEHDGRGTDSWYNYRVKNVHVYGGLGTSALQEYTYTTPVYTGVGNDKDLGDLIGYTTVSEKQLDYNNNNAALLETKHTFGVKGLDIGYELITEWLSGAKILKKAVNTYVTDNTKAPFNGWNYRYLYRTTNYMNNGGNLTVSSQAVYSRDPSTGNLLLQTDYLGTAPYRKTYYEYYLPIRAHILDKASRILVTSAEGDILADTRYHYDDERNSPPIRGDLTLTQSLTGKGGEVVNTGSHYDEYGNVGATTQYKSYGTVGAEPIGEVQESSVVYDGIFHSYPISQTNPLGQSTTTKYIYSLGVPYEVTDANGWATTTTYDGLGRQRSIAVPGVGDEAVWYNYPKRNSNGTINAPYNVEMQILDTAAGTRRSVWGIYDGLGRQIQMQVYDSDKAQTLVTDTEFNAQGAVSRQSSPYYSSKGQGQHVTPAWTQFTSSEYDVLGRVTRVTQPGGLVTHTEYDGFLTTSYDPKGQKIERGTDGMGRLVYVREFSSLNTVYATTRYSYDQMDRLKTTTDAKGNITTLGYDWLGRKTSMDDPDMGVWGYEYNPTGTLTKQTDARGEILTFTYDNLNRMLTKSGNGVNVFYEYGNTPGADGTGNVGMRVGMDDDSGSTTWVYDNYGRTVAETRTIGGDTQQTMTTMSDWLGRPLSVEYPDGEMLTYSYDALGRPKKLASSASLVELAYNALGQVTTQAMGNGITVTNAYNGSDNRLAARTSTGNLINFGYAYDANGNITSITDGVLNETHTFTYDFLNRLTLAEATTTNQAADYKYRQQFTYDQVGNINQMNDWVIPTPQAPGNTSLMNDLPVSYKSSSNSHAGISAVSYRSPGLGSSGLFRIAHQAGDTPTPTPDLIFADGFESGDLSAWPDSGTDGGDLFVSAQSAAVGNYGMEALIDDTTEIGVYDGTISNASHYSARFYLDPNSVNIRDNTSMYVFSGDSGSAGWVFCLSLKRMGEYYSLSACAINDLDEWLGGRKVYITDDWQAVEIEWQAASAAGANDGYLKLWINDMLVDVIENIDSDASRITAVSLGLVSSIASNSSGSVYFDAFESRQGDRIGLDPNGPALTAPLTNMIFVDGFESGDLSLWDDSDTDSEHLSVTAAAAAIGTYGMQTTVDGTNDMWVADECWSNEKQYHARFYLNPANFTLTPDDRVGLFTVYDSSRIAFRVYLRYSGGTYWINQEYRTDSNTSIRGVYRPITAGWQAVEFDWRAASAAGANDGSLDMWINDIPVETLLNIDNDTYWIVKARLGLVDSLDSGMSGTLYFDAFKSNNSEHIGLEPNGPNLTSLSKPPDLAFSDDFESGDFSEWSNTATNSGSLAITTDSAHEGAYGLKANITSTTSLVAYYYPPINESKYRAHFHFNPNSLNLANGSAHYIYDGVHSSTGYRLVRLELLRENNEYKLRGQVRKDDGTYVNTGKYPISNDWHEIEVDWKAAASAASSDGSAGLWIDGNQMETLTGMDNDSLPLSEIRLGATGNLDAGTSGAIYFDAFEAYRTAHPSSFTPTPTFTSTPTSTPAPTNTPTITNTPTQIRTPAPTNTPALTPTPSWPDTAYTTVLLHMDGIDSSTTFVDQTGKSWTAMGNAQVDNLYKKFGNASAVFDGAGDYLETADSEDFNVGSGDFTVDFWFKKNKNGVTQRAFGQLIGDTGGIVGYTSLSTNVISVRFYIPGSTTARVLDGTTPVTDTNWHHYAAAREGNTLRLFLDGILENTLDVTGYTVSNPTTDFWIGRASASTDEYDFNGWIDEFRFSKGIARWTSNFTPPAAPYEMGLTATATPTMTSTPNRTPTYTPTPVKYMGGYWSFDVTDTPTAIPDVAGTPNNATLHGGVQVIPGAQGQAIYFDGTDDYASVPAHFDLRNEGSFTISAWVKPASVFTDHTQHIVQKSDKGYGLITVSTQGTPTPTASVGHVAANGSVAFEVGDLTPKILHGPILPVNTWTLVTGVYDKDAKQTRLYLNGVLAAAQEVTGTVATVNSLVTFSSDDAAYRYHGGLDEVRFYKYALTGEEVQQLMGSVAIATLTPQPMTFTPTPTIATPNITPIPQDARAWGTGNDGSLNVASGTTFNLNTDKSNGRACADGIAYNITELGDTVAVVDAAVNPTPTATPAGAPTPASQAVSSCLAAGDEVLLMRLSGGSAVSYNSGSYEFLRVASVSGNSVTFATPKTRWYGSGWRNDLDIGTALYKYRVMLMRVPNYNNVTIGENGILTAKPYDKNKYGVVAFRVFGSLLGNGRVSANELGYGGSDGYGKGGNAVTSCTKRYGAGAGYGSKGNPSCRAKGGIIYGSPELDKLFLGSGGGMGGRVGGEGGGAILLSGRTLDFDGTISANGHDGMSDINVGSGGGSGGSIRIEGDNISLTTITASGGQGKGLLAADGDGGVGRIAVYSGESRVITSSIPPAYNPANNPTPVPPSTLWGTGADGDLVVPAGTTFNISTDTSNVNTCMDDSNTDGGDGVSYNVLSLEASFAKLSAYPQPGCLDPGDEILLIHHLGSGPNIGNYEFLRVGGVSGDTVYFTTAKTKFYGENAGDDSNIGTIAGKQQVILQRVPNYNTAEIDGTLKTNNRLVFRVYGLLNGSGLIQADDTGYPAMTGYGKGSQTNDNTSSCYNRYGGGGGYGTNGTSTTASTTCGGIAGTSYGSLRLDTLFHGSGGGLLDGGEGGGTIVIYGGEIDFEGTISAKGHDGRSGSMSNGASTRSGGGSGGSVRIEGGEIELTTVNVNGGAGASYGGAGGFGRVAVYCHTALPTVGNLTANDQYIYFEQINQNATPTPTPTATPGGFDVYAKSLLHMDGADASTTFTDQTGRTWTRNGDAQIDTAQSKFGGASAFFDGTGDYLDTPDSEDFNVGSGDFTVDFWFRKNANGRVHSAFGQMEASAAVISRGVYGYIGMDSNVISVRFGSGATIYVLNGDTAITDTNWHHYAAVRNGNMLRLYLDGKLDGTLNVAAGLTVNNSDSKFSIGRVGEYTSTNTNGWIDEFRFSKGIARWTSDFTPPSSSYYGTYVTQTPTPTPTAIPGGFDDYAKSLLHMDGADASTTFTDQAGRTWTAYGNAQVDTAQSKFGGASAIFDGTGDYIDTPDSEDFNVGSGDFTVDFWFRKNANSRVHSSFGQMNASTAVSSRGLYGYIGMDTNVISVRFGSGNALHVLNGATIITDTNWHHYAAVRNGNMLRLYLDGNLDGTLNVAGLTVNNSTSKFSIGRVGEYTGTNTKGSIDEFRFSKGIARWISNFTPPSSAYYQNTPTPTPSPTPQQVEKTYTYSEDAPHAVTSVTDAQNSTLGLYAYDANGNMTCRTENNVTYKQTYNAENRISSIQKIAAGDCDSVTTISTQWDFAYDGDGTRTATLTTTYENGTPQPVELTTYYFGGAYEVTGDTIRKYYSFAGGPVAVREYDTSTPGTSTLSYLLTDHLGSVVAVMTPNQNNGWDTTQQRYLPFGGQRTLSGYSTTALTDYGYTGQRALADDMGGLMDYRARFYSPALGRFLQPDSFIPNPVNPQSWNRYSYVRNNPILYNDPTGHNEDCGIGEACRVGHSNPNDPKPKPKPVIGNIGNGSRDGGGNGGGGSRTPTPTPTTTPQPPIVPVVVPNPQPPGSPSVPTITTIVPETDVDISISIIERNPPPSKGIGFNPQLPLSVYSPFSILQTILDISGMTIDGKKVELPNITELPSMRITTVTTTTTTTITTRDQYDTVISKNQTKFIDSASTTEYKYGDVWLPYRMNPYHAPIPFIRTP